MSGGSRRQTIGYWYHPTFHLALCRGPVDAMLRFRVADVDAWRGELLASGTISIDNPDMWGGENSEGGVQGDMDVMFGDAAQAPNAAVEVIGADGSAHRGLVTQLFKGGRFGAMNPYPKAMSTMLRRILVGWDGDECWYPETAPILLTGAGELTDVVFNFTGDHSNYVVPANTTQLTYRMRGGGGGGGVSIGGAPSTRGGGAGFVSGVLDVTPGETLTLRVGGGGVAGSTDDTYPDGGSGGDRDNGSIGGAGGGSTQILRSGTPLAIAPGGGGGASWVNDGAPGGGLEGSGGNAPVEANGGAGTDSSHGLGGFNQAPYTARERGEDGDGTRGGWGASGSIEPSDAPDHSGGGGGGGHFKGGGGGGTDEVGGAGGGGSALVPEGSTTSAGDGQEPGGPSSGAMGDAGRGGDMGEAGDHGRLIFSLPGEFLGINPAHLLYYSLTAGNMQGEPVELINEASFAAAADLFFAEGLGLCTVWDPDAETIEQFRQRICEAVGARCSRSTVDGQWYLDVMRGQYELEELPILTDDDILDFEVQPAVMDDAVNQVAVQWFDPLTKQERTTAPLHALGAIDGNAVNAQTFAYSCLPTEDLALRTAARELRARATPLCRYQLTTNRKPFSWRTGTYFRLQAPKRRVADMVCLVGDIEKGTLRSGAIQITAVQDVYAMPAATYIVGQAPVDTTPTAPAPVAEQRVEEAPYVELVGWLSAADLAALPSDAGYLLALGVRPGVGINYQLDTRPGAGEYAAGGTFDWCPVATVVEAADKEEVEFTLDETLLLDRVAVGTAALWGDEIVRVDALDVEAGSVTLARGCADTVPHTHAAGERIWFYDAWGGSDQVEYVDGETVQAKLRTRTGTAMLDQGAAPTASLALDARAARPYPPADLLINGAAWPDASAGTVAVTWSHRDRLLQADQLVDTTEASIGPEPGTTYSMQLLRVIDDVVLASASGIADDAHALGTTYTGLVRLQVWSVRDGLESWQRQEHVFSVAGGALRATESGEDRVTEDGEDRQTE